MIVVMSVACPYCTKPRHPGEILQLPGGAKICRSCYHQHEAAVLALSGLKANDNGTFTASAPPPLQCSECEVTPEQLKQQGRGGDTWSVIYEHGVYRYFCIPCADVYETKRRELFKNTAYAKQRGL